MIETLQYFCLFQKIFPVSSYLFPIISFMVTVSLLKRAWTVDSTEHVLVLLPWWFIIKEFGWHRIFWKWNFLWRNRWNLEKSHNFRILRSYWLTSAKGKQRKQKKTRPATLLRRDSKTDVLPVTIGKFLRTLFLPHISVGCFCTPNEWIFCVFTFYLVDLIAVLRNKRQCADFNKFLKVKSNPLVCFLWEIREDSVSKAQRKGNMIKTKDKFFGFL